MNLKFHNSTRPYAIGVDLGGTKVAVAVVNSDGAIRHKIKAPTIKGDPSASINQINALAREVIEKSSLAWSDIEGVGVCIPGVYFAQTGEAWAPNVWGDERVALHDKLKEEIAIGVVIDSDRAAYVIGEQWLGVARGLSEIVFVAVGTGIGAGIITGGKLCRGANNIAGAVGWFALGHRSHQSDKQIGAFEYEAAGPAVARQAIARIGAGEPSRLQELSNCNALTTELVVQAAVDGDEMARNVLNDTSAYLGMGIANIISILNPEVVVLGGGLMNAGALMLDRIRQETVLWAQPLAVQQCRIELTGLGDDAGLLGAARLAFLS